MTATAEIDSPGAIEGTPEKSLVGEVLDAWRARIRAWATISRNKTSGKVLASQGALLGGIHRKHEEDLAFNRELGKDASDIANKAFGRSRFSQLFNMFTSSDKKNAQTFFKEVLFNKAISVHLKHISAEEGADLLSRITFFKSGIVQRDDYERWKETHPEELKQITKTVTGVDPVSTEMSAGGFKKIRRKGSRNKTNQRKTKKRKTNKRKTKKRKTNQRKTKKRKTNQRKTKKRKTKKRKIN